MDTFHDLDTLELIMNRNTSYASFSRSPSSSVTHPAVTSVPQESESEADEVQTDAVSEQSPFSSLLGMASLSLALSANARLAATKGLSTSQKTAPSKVILAPVVKGSLPSQVRCIAPVPVSGPTALSQMSLSPPSIRAPVFTPGHATAFPDLVRLSGNTGYRAPIGVAGICKTAIMWYRNDLRVHDNEALSSANEESLSVLPVYCFDPRDYGKSTSGFDKTGQYRAKFLIECVADLRASLRAKGSDLIVRVGRPEEVLLKLAGEVGATALYAHQEVTYEELQSESKVAAAIQEKGVDAKFFWGSTLYHVDDLPFKLEEMPSNYGGFKTAVHGVTVRTTCTTAVKLRGLPKQGDVRSGKIPTLQDLGITASNKARQEPNVGGAALVGGESEALQRLKRFVAEAACQVSRPEKSNEGSGGENIKSASFSCKISPWLAMGCVSPRKMFEDLQQSSRTSMGGVSASSGGGDESGLNWLVFELLWRDFFRFITKKYGGNKQGAKAPTPALACA